ARPFPFLERPISMLNMRSRDDHHAKAKIRNAAVDCFGRHGFDVGIRQIAEMAGASPGLVAHHFGFNAGLRAQCDSHVLTRMLDAKLETVGPQGPEAMLMQLAKVEEYRPIAAYAVASLAAGGDLANELLDEMTRMTAEFLAAGEEAGTIRPSSDAHARARYLTLTGMGMLLLEYRRHFAAHPEDPAGAFDAAAQAS